jgi:hypothetical protein
MKPEAMEKLRDARDFYALTKGVLALCEPFGAVHSFRFAHNRGASTVACFIELESPKQQPALARALGTRTLNGEACLEIPVRKDFGGQGRVVALAAAPSVSASGFDPRIAQPSVAQAANSPASR